MSSQYQQEFDTCATDEVAGVRTTVEYKDQWVTGRVRIIESDVEADGWPEIGEVVTLDDSVTHKQVRVEDIDKGRFQSINVGLAGWVNRTDIVECRTTRTHKVIELDTGEVLYEHDFNHGGGC